MSRIDIATYKDGCLQYEIVNGLPFLHFETFKWSHTLHRDWQAIFRTILDEFADKGWEFVYFVANKDNKKLQKFGENFGFWPIKQDETSIVFARSTE